MSNINFEQKAKNIVALRSKIEEVEKQTEEILTPLKIERDAMQSEMVEGLKDIGTRSFKTLDKSIGISIGERRSLQIVNEEKIITYLKKKKLKDLFKMQLVKPLFKGYATQAIKNDNEIPGTEMRTTEFISVRNLKKGGKNDKK